MQFGCVAFESTLIMEGVKEAVSYSSFPELKKVFESDETRKYLEKMIGGKAVKAGSQSKEYPLSYVIEIPAISMEGVIKKKKVPYTISAEMRPAFNVNEKGLTDGRKIGTHAKLSVQMSAKNDGNTIDENFLDSFFDFSLKKSNDVNGILYKPWHDHVQKKTGKSEKPEELLYEVYRYITMYVGTGELKLDIDAGSIEKIFLSSEHLSALEAWKLRTMKNEKLLGWLGEEKAKELKIITGRAHYAKENYYGIYHVEHRNHGRVTFGFINNDKLDVVQVAVGHHKDCMMVDAL